MRYYAAAAGIGSDDTASVACESQCAMAARDIVGDTLTWSKKLEAGMWPAGCETQASCIQTVKRQCMDENCCKLHKQRVDQNCGLAQMLALESTDLCQESLASMKAAGCSTSSAQNALVANALTEFQVAHTGGAKTGLARLVSAGASCSSMIAQVQRAIGVTADGQWGPKSQAALDARGGDFRAFAPGCQDPVPHYSATTGKTTSVTTYVAPPVIQQGGPTPRNAGLILGVAAAAAAVVIYYVVKKK